MSKIKETTFLFIITIIFFSFGVVGNIAAADPVKVLILPFTINSDKDLSFLRKGVADMLSSRLALKDQIMVIDKWCKKNRITQCLKTLETYGAAAKAVLPELRQLEKDLRSHSESRMLADVTKQVQSLIKKIDSADGTVELRSINDP